MSREQNNLRTELCALEQRACRMVKDLSSMRMELYRAQTTANHFGINPYIMIDALTSAINQSSDLADAALEIIGSWREDDAEPITALNNPAKTPAPAPTHPSSSQPSAPALPTPQLPPAP